MTISGVKYANGVARDAVRKGCKIVYGTLRPESRSNVQIVVFSDAVFPHQGVSKKVAQEGCLFGISFGVKKNTLYHTIGWLYRKQRRESHSSGRHDSTNFQVPCFVSALVVRVFSVIFR